MCKNQHHHCSCCIKKHLENSAFCPTCLEHLSVDTLNEVPRIVNDYISELNIRCDFYPRGFPEIVQVENLKRHVGSCGFSPVQCSNDGCNVLVNTSNKLDHETEVCDFGKLKCHQCGQLKNEVRELRDEMLARQKKMKNEMKDMKQEVKEMIRNEIERIKMELKNDIKNEVKGMNVEIKNQMKEMREEVKTGIKGEVNRIKEEMKNEMRGMKVEIRNEMKGIIKN
ncbi:RING finger 151-like [Paramuricea clavata]|uniref:RING finger 151-like n=1 Tax=Paramuricea clavata TaxID=317549 RepID=A0A6S7GH74_PARCT|nr:RING finger 151-like [Paramuricea clavata]